MPCFPLSASSDLLQKLHPPSPPLPISNNSLLRSPPFPSETMAVVLDSSTGNAPSEAESHAEEEEQEAAGLGRAFDMVSLEAHLPKKRKGLSVHFSGKSRSFACLGDAKCVGDLEKPGPEIPDAKRRKYVERRRAVALDVVPWRAAQGASHCGPCVGV